MKIATLILRVRITEVELRGSLEDPLSGWHVIFTSLDGLGALLHKAQRQEYTNDEGRSLTTPDEDTEIDHL